MIKAVSWNIAHRKALWQDVVSLDADIALLQEAPAPPSDIAGRVETDQQPWRTDGGNVKRDWRAAVVGLNSDVQLTWNEPKSIGEADWRSFAASRPGTLSVATVTAPDQEAVTFVSMYGAWESPHDSLKSRWIYADASVHRVISDLSVLIGTQRGHRIVAAGDLNILYGYGEGGSRYWGARHQTAFDRFAAIGMRFVGPQSPHGRQAEPWPKELPKDSLNVPTYHTAKQKPAGATRQLDFVFASEDIADQIRVRALNRVEEWGPSDHCRIEIEVGQVNG